jgi:hypothetical protein
MMFGSGPEFLGLDVLLSEKGLLTTYLAIQYDVAQCTPNSALSNSSIGKELTVHICGIVGTPGLDPKSRPP